MAVNEAILIEAVLIQLLRPAIEAAAAAAVKEFLTRVGTDKVIQIIRSSDVLDDEAKAALGLLSGETESEQPEG